jgi:putative addiction module component (TIGR02574 family)
MRGQKVEVIHFENDNRPKNDHVRPMSKAEILEEIPSLTPEERDEIRRKLDELDDSLTPEEWALIDKRIAEHEADPQSAIPWEKFKADLDEKFGQ